MLVLDTASANFEEEFAPLENRFDAGALDKKISSTVQDILAMVRKDGDDALFKLTKKYDSISLSPSTIAISQAEMKKAGKEISPKLKSAINTAHKNITEFHKKQVEKSWTMKTGKSGKSKIGQIVTPIRRAGLYVPGGTASYPSSVLMNAIPANVAGVKEIVICSPTPNDRVEPALLYAASLCGVKEFYRVGGAQAVGALAFGTETIKKVDKITGPGNAWVAEAKRQVFGQVDIDMIAGPSEVCIVADNDADPEWVAADILSQAEHDELAWTFLISPSKELIQNVVIEISMQVESLERRDIASKSFANRFFAIKTKSIPESIKLANRLAIEHLELAFKGADKMVKDIRNAGAIFVGNYSPEVLGDYFAGPNHVLPTSGSARFFSPLGVYDFQKRSSLINYTKNDFLDVAEKVALIAESEGLTGHAKSARIRIK